jgi:type II secretory pathway pseudopilin PulG
VAGIRRISLAVIVVAIAAGGLATSASASQLIARDASNVRLAVDARGRALLTYRAQGRTRHVLAWGAVNAIHATTARKQVAFRVDYTGGWRSFGRTLWKGFDNACTPTKVGLAWVVAACRARDGSYWALQSWQRGLRNYGLPATGTRDDWELRLSHWTGAVPMLEVGIGWAYQRFHSLFGRYTWRGRGIHGFVSTPAGIPLDSFGRNLYVDTLNSAYGPGWQRENGFLSHVGTGGFCYGFYPHGERPSGMGERYRLSVSGPGVLPDAYWEGTPPRTYDPEYDRAADEKQSELLSEDRLCRPR